MAISNFTYILSTVDLLETYRKSFCNLFPNVCKLATCKFCQSFWLSGLCSLVLSLFYWPQEIVLLFPIRVLLIWFSMHLFSRTIHKIDDGIPLIFPMGVYSMVNIKKDDNNEIDNTTDELNS